jgi:putative Mg2+ transporter-C (MgtC) family protein
MILICLGSTLFTIFSIELATPWSDPARIAAQIVTGVGFLGAGAILHDRRQVSGLTTAASIWLVAAIGIGVGAGAFLLTTLSTALVVIVLFAFGQIQRLLDNQRHDQTYLLQLTGGMSEVDRLLSSARRSGLRISRIQLAKADSLLRLSFRAIGPRPLHGAFVNRLIDDSAIVAFSHHSIQRGGLTGVK